MKTLFLLFSLLLALNLPGQCPYFQKYMNKGDAQMRKDSFETAIYAYSIAMRLCPDSTDKVQKRIVEVFKKINKLKGEAEAAKERVESTLKKLEDQQKRTNAALDYAEKQRDSAKIERDKKDVALKDLEVQQNKTQALLAETDTLKNQAETALKKAKDLIAAYYFYEGKFAVAFKNGKYCYIDTMGQEVERLGRWDRAEQFSIQTGLAKVGIHMFQDMKYYLLDTLGSFHPTINNNPFLPISDHHYIQALDLSEKRGFPLDPSGLLVIRKLEGIKLLIVNSKIYTPLNKILKKFNNLEHLDLSDNDLKSLPNSLYDLKKLKYLDLRNNPLLEEEKIKVFRLLPNCEIDIGQYNSIDTNSGSQINYLPHYGYVKAIVEKNTKKYKHWFRLSYYSLLINKHAEAIQAAQKALTLAPKKHRVEVNKALNYLRDGQWAKAQEIYLSWKDKKFRDER